MYLGVPRLLLLDISERAWPYLPRYDPIMPICGRSLVFDYTDVVALRLS